MNENLFKSLLKERADKINIILNNKQLNQFYQYKELIIGWNKKINLTAITDDEEFINKHFIDALTIAKYTRKESKIIDIGTGAGVPGIPLNIYSNCNFVLLDSLNKRIKVLDDIIENIKLENIKTLHGRAEEVLRNSEYREKFDIATSRAVASLDILVELMIPAVKVGGICICMKAGKIEEELKEAQNAIKILGGKIDNIESFILPDTNIERNIVVIKKIKNTPSKFPRKPGTPAKDPIK